MTPYEQRMDALQRANERRVAIGDLRRRIHALPEVDGRRLLVSVLENPDDVMGAAPAERLLLSVRGFGLVKTRKVLRLAGVMSANRRLRELTPRQRAVIADVLRHPRQTLGGARPDLEDAA